MICNKDLKMCKCSLLVSDIRNSSPVETERQWWENWKSWESWRGFLLVLFKVLCFICLFVCLFWLIVSMTRLIFWIKVVFVSDFAPSPFHIRLCVLAVNLPHTSKPLYRQIAFISKINKNVSTDYFSPLERTTERSQSHNPKCLQVTF